MAEVTKETEVKEVSKTEQFKEHLQKIIWQSTGKKVAKSTAWELYKNLFHGTVEFVLNDEDKKLPLAGVATFEILETKPRGSKAGLKQVVKEDGSKVWEEDPDAEAWDVVPRFRVYPSSVIDTLVEYKYGLGGHSVEEKHYGIFKPDEETEAEFKAKDTAKKADKDKAAKVAKAPKAKKAAEPEGSVEDDLDDALADLDEI